MDEKWLKEALAMSRDLGEAMKRVDRGEAGQLAVSVALASLEAHLRRAVTMQPIKTRWQGPVKVQPAPTPAPLSHSADPPMDES